MIDLPESVAAVLTKMSVRAQTYPHFRLFMLAVCLQTEIFYIRLELNYNLLLRLECFHCIHDAVYGVVLQV